MLAVSSSPCCRYHPAGVFRRFSQSASVHAAFALRLKARPPGLRIFGAIYAFAFAAARRLAHRPEDGFWMGFKSSLSLLPAIHATEPLAFALAGFLPAEHNCLIWTHNRTCGFIASGSRTRNHALQHVTPPVALEHLVGGYRLSATPQLFATSCVVLELWPLPSAGVTRLHRYYGPIRHPRKRPSLSLAGCQLTVTCRHRWGFPCYARFPLHAC